MSNFYRTEAQKTTHYLPNGEGRDTYISVNNGGVQRNTYPFVFKEQGRMTRRNFTFGSPNLGSKPIKYTSDGTGRDTYIGFNHGGLMSPYTKHTFYSALRTPSPKLTKVIRTQTFSQYTKKIQEAKSQKEAVFRLSIPKFPSKYLNTS
ncbi:hypothetical protein SteCoe_14739 [Stentor coeruleus]|uniref:Uncharacterized protein n=1 Tax=Stentor coeruleus TaxID=5963 RepID=A0A1R2C5C0_9CILI|nr:hypothetical protein SteCoe_14739 [Stentor coeruleus]